MKKILAYTVLLCTTFAATAQMTVTTYGSIETTINDGDVFGFNSLDPDDATLYFYIHNDGDEDINVRVKVEEITNTDGSNFQFCFATLCVFDIFEDNTYPLSGGPVVIAPGETNAQYDKFQNENSGSGTFPLDYVFKIFQVDGEDNEIGDPITFTYRYDPDLSVGENTLRSVGVSFDATYIDNVLQLNTTNPVQIKMYNLNGQHILSQQLQAGAQTIDVTALKSGLYLAHFTNGNGKTATAKFVKK